VKVEENLHALELASNTQIRRHSNQNTHRTPVLEKQTISKAITRAIKDARAGGLNNFFVLFDFVSLF
jgi:hypothetical protein